MANNNSTILDGIKRSWFCKTLGRLSIYFIESYFFDTSSLCCTYYYDVPKPTKPKDREQAQHDYQTNIDAKKEIEALQLQLSKIEMDKLDRILEILNKTKV